jgi:cobalamin biosynthesis Mg chelatase CobN
MHPLATVHCCTCLSLAHRSPHPLNCLSLLQGAPSPAVGSESKAKADGVSASRREATDVSSRATTSSSSSSGSTTTASSASSSDSSSSSGGGGGGEGGGGAVVVGAKVGPEGCGESRGQHVLLPDEISIFDGTHPSGKIMLVVLGQVYDVTKGKEYYGLNANGERVGYNMFAGWDASRAFVSGEFDRSKVSEGVCVGSRRLRTR